MGCWSGWRDGGDRRIGAVPMDEWTVQRLDEGALKRFAGEEAL